MPQIVLAALFCSLSAPTAVKAADIVWVGGTGNWNVPANWSPAQVPGAADAALITGSGTYTVTVPDSVNPTVASLVLGAASGTQTLSLGRSVLTLNGTGTVGGNGRLVLTVGNSTLTGPGALTVDGTLDWASGTMSGSGSTSIGAGGVLLINGGVTLTARTLNNAGHATWASGNFTAGSGVVINNQVGGVFELSFDGRLNVATAPATFSNAGLVQKTGGTGAGANLNLVFNSGGTVQAEAGTLSLDGGGTHTGTIATAAGATLNFGGGSHTLASGSLVTGAGAVGVSGNATTLTAAGNFDAGATLSLRAGTVTLSAGCNVSGATLNIGGGLLNFNTASAVNVVNLTAGTLGGSSAVNVSGPLTLGGGTVTSGLVTANGGLTINGNVTLNGAKLINPGTAVWSAGNFNSSNGAVISNLFGATFTTTFDGNNNVAGATPLFVNAGSFIKSGGSAALGTTSIDSEFINTGTVEVQTNTLRYAGNQQTAGITLLGGGGLAAQAQPLQILGGVLTGSGPVGMANTQPVINSGIVSPGSPVGQIDITGNYQQTGSGALDIDIAGYTPGSEFDVVTVTGGGAGGVATLGGSLNVAFADGFTPTNGATFTFLTAVSRVGTFAAFSYPSNEVGMQLITDATSASVKVTNLRPVVANPIADPAPVAYGSGFNFQVPANTFVDPDGDTLSYAAAGLPPGITFNPGTRTFSGTPGGAGTFPVAVIAADSASPSLSATNIFLITVNKAALAVSADSFSRTYGAADPAFTANYSGFVNGDTPASLSGSLTLTRAPGENVGTYAITPGGVTSANYTIAFNPGTLTITRAPLSATADSKSKVYGSADPSFTASYSGFVNGDSAGSLGGALTFTRAPGENVGTYAITPAGLTSVNYTVAFNPATLTITPAPLSVTADSKTKVYGAADPSFTASYSGFVNGDGAGSLGGTLTFTRAPGENVGTYVVTPAGLTSANYTIAFNPGTITITPAPLSVTADSKSKVYGSADSSFTASYSGFVNGDGAGSLGGTLTFTRAPGENVGTYAITPGGVTSANYTIEFNPGTLTITPAALSVTADSKSKVYGSADPSFTASYSGFVNGDGAGSLGGTVIFTRAPGENVGTYAITPAGLTSANYTIAFNPGTLTITPVPLSVTADSKSKIYGSADPSFTASYSGFVNGDNAGSLGGTLTFTRAPGENVGTYAVTPTGLTSVNYTIAFNPGTLTITPAPLLVTADSKSKIYGSADPSFTASYSGFVNGESAGSLGGTLTFTRAPGENVGTYAITPAGLTSANYTIAFNPGTFTINRAALLITAGSKTKPEGSADPAFTASYSGFVNRENPNVLAGTLTFTRKPGETPGDYAITPEGVSDPNYAITFAAGTLTITPRAVAPTLSIAAGTPGNLVLTWNAASNVTYRVQFNGDLTGTNWANLPGDVTATGPTASKADANNGAARFYRLQIVR